MLWSCDASWKVARAWQTFSIRSAFFRLTYRLCSSYQGLVSLASCWLSVSSFWSRSSSACCRCGNNALRAPAFTSKGPWNVTKCVLQLLHITSVVSDNSHFLLPFLVCDRTLKHTKTLSLTLFSFFHSKTGTAGFADVLRSKRKPGCTLLWSLVPRKLKCHLNKVDL